MTQLNHQQQQKKNQDVIEAGRGAYRMDIAVNGNPHSKQPYRDLWDKGWRLERRKDEAVRMPRTQQRPPFKKPYEAGSARPPYPKRNEQRNIQHNRPAQTGRINPTKPSVTSEPQPVLTDKLINRFNRRHQTRA